MPRMERARRPPEAENRAHIPRAIASREIRLSRSDQVARRATRGALRSKVARGRAMLWQGCSLSPRELERKAPRSVWATQLPASRPIRWIVRESREANRTDSPASHRTDFATHPARPRTDSPAFYRTNFARAHARQSDGLTFGIPSPAFPRTDSPALGRPTPIQPFPNPDMDGINRHATTSQPSFGSNTRTTRFRLNLPTSLIRQLQPILINNSTSTTPRPRHNRPYPVLTKPFISPSNLDHQTKRRARPEDRALRFSRHRVIGHHTAILHDR